MSTVADDTKLEGLSDAQRSIYELMMKNKKVDAIASKLNLGEGIVRAQITRIINKGIEVPDQYKPTVSGTKFTTPTKSAIHEATKTFREQALAQPTERVKTSSKSSNDEIAAFLQSAGVASSPELIKQLSDAADKHAGVIDSHPMILLGCTIQYVRLCGGRFHAHQLIEDIYEALRLFVNDGPGAKEPVHQTQPWNDPRVKQLEEENKRLKEELQASR